MSPADWQERIGCRPYLAFFRRRWTQSISRPSRIAEVSLLWCGSLAFPPGAQKKKGWRNCNKLREGRGQIKQNEAQDAFIRKFSRSWEATRVPTQPPSRGTRFSAQAI